MDGQHTWQEGSVLMGHCLLSMLPGQSLEPAPIVADDLVLTADVRLDNSMHLIRHTGADKGSSDQQLLLHAYLTWGDKCVHHLEGEYAFAVWHKTQRRLFIATDHIGHRALYYYDAPDLFIFSSEQKGVLAAKPRAHVFDDTSLIEYHFRQANPHHTYTKDVHALCGGNQLTLDNNTLHMKRYWSPVTGRYQFSKYHEWTDCLRGLLTAAIRNRVRTDRPVGITLSGGLDSSSIACLLAKELAAMNKPLYAFSSVLADTAQGKDERAYIETVGKYCPNIIQTYVDAGDGGPFTGTLPAFGYDETFPNIFFYVDHAILQAARGQHIGLLFTGYGGDHWVSWQGNPVVYNLVNKGRLGSAWRLIKAFAQTEKKHPLQIIKQEYAAHTALYRTLRGHKRQPLKSTCLQQTFCRKYQSALDFSPVRDINAYMSANINSGRTGVFPSMLANRNEAYGMQSAVPLLDKAILEFMMDVPQQLFVAGGHKRSLLRHAMEGVLPPAVQWRKDKGMYSPDFMARIGRNRPMVEDMLASEEHTVAFSNYVCKKRIRQLESKDELSTIRMVQAVIAGLVIADLLKKGYVFDRNFS
jgi:asparagine synthase (glutamine-hydrolysing)